MHNRIAMVLDAQACICVLLLLLSCLSCKQVALINSGISHRLNLAENTHQSWMAEGVLKSPLVLGSCPPQVVIDHRLKNGFPSASRSGVTSVAVVSLASRCNSL